MRILLTLQYLGTRYAGWQRQANAIAIQQVVEEALSTIYEDTIRIEGAGRTDSGVHAAGQKAHADVPFAIDPRGLRRGLNDALPADIRICSVEEVAESFHCRFDAKRKTYAYRMWNDDIADVFHAETHAFVPYRLDVSLMHDAAQALRGTHDFRAFTVAEPEVSSTTRTVHEVSVSRHGRVVTLTITADGFLRYMVRRIAGSLVEIGRGKLEPNALARSLHPGYEVSRWTALAKGLTLISIDYEEKPAKG